MGHMRISLCYPSHNSFFEFLYFNKFRISPAIYHPLDCGIPQIPRVAGLRECLGFSINTKMDKKKIIIIAIVFSVIAGAGFLLLFKGSAAGNFLKNAGFGFELKDPPQSGREARDFKLDRGIFTDPKYERLSEKYDLRNEEPKPGNPNPFGGQ
jgi:hypothetical protein